MLQDAASRMAKTVGKPAFSSLPEPGGQTEIGTKLFLEHIWGFIFTAHWNWMTGWNYPGLMRSQRWTTTSSKRAENLAKSALDETAYRRKSYGRGLETVLHPTVHDAEEATRRNLDYATAHFSRGSWSTYIRNIFKIDIQIQNKYR